MHMIVTFCHNVGLQPSIQQATYKCNQFSADMQYNAMHRRRNRGAGVLEHPHFFLASYRP